MSQTTPSAEAEKVQQAPVKPAPAAEHVWLQKLVGEWTYESGDGPGKVTGTESVRSIGGLWILAEGRGEVPGSGPETTVMTLGYDPDTKRFVGTWIGSMMTYLWRYDGSLDGSRNVLTLNSEGPSMSGDGTMSPYQDVIEFKSDDHRVLTARVLGTDGKWQQFMTMEYRRRVSR